MRFKTSVDVLKAALKKVGHAVNQKSVLPALTNIMVECLDTIVMFESSDLQITIFYSVTDAEVIEKGKCLIPFQQLKNIVDVEDGSCEISCTEDYMVTLVFNQKDVFNLGKVGETKDFPKLPKATKTQTIETDGELVKAIKQASLSVSKDFDFKPVLCNILIDIKSEMLSVVSTDTFGIYEQVIKGQFPTLEQNDSQLLFSPIVAKILEEDVKVVVAFNNNHVFFTSGNTVVVCKKSEGKFPNWRVPMGKHEANMLVQIETLKDAVTKAFVLSDATYNGIDFHIDSENLMVQSNSDVAGVGCKLDVEVKSTSEVKHVRFNGAYLKRLIAQLGAFAANDSVVEFSIKEANKPITTKLSDNESVTVLIMPVSII